MGGFTSKQAFEEIFAQLQEKDIEASNHEFWDELHGAVENKVHEVECK